MGGVAWTEEEDHLLRNCIEQYGEGKWHRVPLLAGLNRCRKSCRLRWLNYLRPNIRRGRFTEDEVELIIKLHKLLGNRWSLIAGRLPGRTANDVKNFWNCHLSKKLNDSNNYAEANKETDNAVEVIKSLTWPQNLSISPIHSRETDNAVKVIKSPSSRTEALVSGHKLAHDAASTSKEAPPRGPCNSGLYQVFHKQGDDDKFPCLGGLEQSITEEGLLPVDFELEEIRVMGEGQSKHKWDLDDLVMDLELWSDSL